MGAFVMLLQKSIDDLLGLRQLISGGVYLKTLAPKVVAIALLIKDCYLLLMMLLSLGSIILYRLPFVIIMSTYFFITQKSFDFAKQIF